MKMLMYHASAVIVGACLVWLFGYVMPLLFLFFVLIGPYVAFVVSAYVIGLIVLSHAMPGRTRKSM